MSTLILKFFIQIIFLYWLIGSANIALALNLQFQKKNVLLLDVMINQEKKTGIFELYEDRNGDIWVNASDLKKWNFPQIQHTPLSYAGKKYYALSWYPSLRYQLDRNKLIIIIWVPSSFFSKTIVDLSGYNTTLIRPKKPGVFLNYDFTAIRNPVIHDTSYSTLMELGVFNHYGVGTTDFLVSNYNAVDPSSPSYHAVRLNTTWTLDQPEKIATWRFGDSITGASNWSTSARFGGIQYATNFNTQPDFITFPLPGFHGDAIVPTNVDIFVNGVLSQHNSVERGAYLINNIPVVTGAGMVNVVTQDLLGRTTTVSLPYYASPTLLKPGLSRYSYETGFLRSNYGINSNQYKNFLATATYQYGINDHLTVGSHEELLRKQQTIGVSLDYLFKNLGIISLATAGSHSQFGQGWLGSLGLTRQTSTMSVGYKSTFMSTYYQQVGLRSPEESSQGALTTHQIFCGYNIGSLGSFGLSYTVTKLLPINHAEARLSKIATANYSRSLFNNAVLTLSAVKDFHDSNNNQIYASVIISLDNLHTINAYLNQQNTHRQPGVVYTRNLPLGDGYGYHVIATNNGDNGSGADFTYRNEAGTYTARAYHVSHENYYEADVSGAIIYFDRQLLLSRKMTQGFALVQVPGYENVRIYYQNQLIGRTNRDGNLLIPEMLPYQENLLTIEARDLPLTAQLSNTMMNVRSYYRSGVLAQFAVKESHSIALRLVQTNGSFVPLGTDVLIDDTHYSVGYDGILFVSDYHHDVMNGKATWNNQQCFFNFVQPIYQHHDISIKKVICT